MSSHGISRRMLRELAGVQVTAPAPALVDARSEQAAALLRVDEAEMETLGRVFAGTGLMGDRSKVRVLLTLRRQISESWSNVRDAFIEIGRTLNDVDRALEAPERDALKRGFAQLFPFSEPIASQFRKIAAAVDAGHLPLDACPGNYSTAYQLALLTPAQMEAARELGLVRPDVPRATLIAFRRRARQEAPPEEIDFKQLRQELRRLEGEWRHDIDVLRSKRHRMKQIRALLAARPTG